MKKVCVYFSMLLTIGLLSACSSTDESDSTDTSSCISGIVHYDGQGQYVYISELNMPDNYAYSHINTVVVPLTGFPITKHRNGDVIYFTIVEVIKEYPIINEYRDGLHRATSFLCSIKLQTS